MIPAALIAGKVAYLHIVCGVFLKKLRKPDKWRRKEDVEGLKNCLQQTESASHLHKKQEKVRQRPDTGPESSLSIYCSPKPNLK